MSYYMDISDYYDDDVDLFSDQEEPVEQTEYEKVGSFNDTSFPSVRFSTEYFPYA